MSSAPEPCTVREPRGPASPPDPASELEWSALRPAGWYPRWGHAVLDAALLVAALPLVLPVGLAVALANWVAFGDWRRILFRQPRIGYRGRVFTIYKFRTMREAAERDVASWQSGGDRARVTRLGRFLRNAHLDELPQVLNVLRGEMSFIGPRPEMVEIEQWAAARIPGFTTRMAVKPGISGYAQVTQGYAGNDIEAYRDKFRAADRYRRELSLGLDLEIVVRTVAWMLRGRGWQWNAAPRGGSAPTRQVEPTRVEAPVGARRLSASEGARRRLSA